MDFSKFKHAVAKQFDRMQKHDLLTVLVENDALWNTYLASFPPGTNPMFRKRTEYDCSCCRSFIKKVGKVVAIIDGKLESVFDIKSTVEPAFQIVADALATLIKSSPISNAFLTTEKVAGLDKNFENLVGDVKTWEHYFVNIPAKFVVKNTEIGPKLSETQAVHGVMLRSLEELTVESVETVLELIAQNSLYRGAEHTFALESFAKLQKEFWKLATDQDRNLFVWSRIAATPASVSRIRNTAIGTLLIDLSNGKDMDDAVKSFEAVVAPANYKRPTALVTKAQVEKAKQTITELGLTSALERRYATIDDIMVNNVLFTDRSARKLDADVFDEITTKSKSKKSIDKVEEIGIDKFISDVLPKVQSIEVLMENHHAPNLVSLIAPVDPTAGKLFKWLNNFSWSYNGDMADSIKERVKKAGGNVTGELCCRLAWNYTDDLDFHMDEPGYKIYYGNRRMNSPNGGTLDVDANGADGIRTDPVENIYYDQLRSMKDGTYTLRVNNYHRRSTGAGFEVEIDVQGTVHKMAYDKVIKTGEFVEVAILQRTRAGVAIVRSLPSTQVTKKVWGVDTQSFHRVKAVMLSPNFWDGGSFGNKHFFFMIDGCANDGKARGFFNEFLKEELNAHRKVIEIVGSKMRTEESEHQLSGLGFSSTQRNSLTCRVKGSFSRIVKVIF